MAAGGVISGATLGRGGRVLARHLADRRRVPENGETYLGTVRGIIAEDVEEAIMELTQIVSHAKSSQPIYHVHADPRAPWTDAQYGRFWALLEEEFGFQDRPFVEAVHVKHGRQHRHRVYSRVRADGTVVLLGNDYKRREKIARRVECEFGQQHVVGRHNRRVAALLESEGHADVVTSMAKAGLLTATRPEARLTPAQRHQAERTGIDVVVIPDIALTVWLATETEELEAVFAAHGLRLCRGDKVPVLVDIAGGVHNLPRVIGKASAVRGRRILAAEVKQRISQIKLPIYNAGGNDGRAESPQAIAEMDHQASAGSSESQAFTQSGTISGPANRSNRRARPQSRRGRRAVCIRQRRRGQKAVGRPVDTQARRKNQLGAHSDRDGSTPEDADPQPGVAKRSVRQIVRARSADLRVERYLAEPELASRLDQLEALADLLDPSRPLQRMAEDLRVEALLSTAELQRQISLLEEMAADLVTIVVWIWQFLFGSVDDRLQTEVCEGPQWTVEPS
jgi:hypothetical protein